MDLPKHLTRRKLLSVGGVLVFTYPTLAFLGFTLPRKPTYIQINKPMTASGFYVTNDFVLFDRNEKCWALSRKCTHLGCKLNYHEELDVLECPCHQSQFDASSGQVIRGPAKKPLASFHVDKRQSDPFYVVTT